MASKSLEIAIPPHWRQAHAPQFCKPQGFVGFNTLDICHGYNLGNRCGKVVPIQLDLSASNLHVIVLKNYCNLISAFTLVHYSGFGTRVGALAYQMEENC